MDAIDDVIASPHFLQCLSLERHTVPGRTIRQYDVQGQNMITGFAIDTRPFARGIRAHHAANRGPVTRRKLRRKENTMRFDMRIELIEHHPRFYPSPALVVIHFQYPVHMPGEIDDDPFGQRLPIGSRAAPSRREGEVRILGLIGQCQDRLYIRLRARKQDGLRRYLVDGVVS